MFVLNLILACWIVFTAYWLISARSTKKTAEPQSVENRTFRIRCSILAFGALLLYKSVPVSFWNSLIVPPTPATQTIAVGLCVLGLLGALWSRRTLAGNWSGAVVFKENHDLIERGPYRFVRHPIYTSFLLMALGTQLAIGSLGQLGFFLFLIAGLCIKLEQEEKLMLRHFPTQYSAYKSHVKALIPYVL